MNTVNDYIKHGVDIKTAIDTVNRNSKKIGTLNGIYEISDIQHDFNRKSNIVTLVCTGCGKKITREMISGRNKWTELIKTCECQKNQKIKKEIEEPIAEDICETKKVRMQYNDESFIGKQFNYLTVIGIRKNKWGTVQFICRCECGNIKYCNANAVYSGKVKSCGCKREELLKKRRKEPLEYPVRLLGIWKGMKTRCYNKNAVKFYNYGGRGIVICDEWKNNFESFAKWALNNGYEDNLSIDRINNYKGYCPDNCRWATAKEQANNKRNIVEWRTLHGKAIVDGKIVVKKDYCDEHKISMPCVNYRIKTNKMSFIEAVNTPKRTSGRPRKECAVCSQEQKTTKTV